MRKLIGSTFDSSPQPLTDLLSHLVFGNTTWRTFLLFSLSFFLVVFVSLVLNVMDCAESTSPSPPLEMDLNQLLQVIHTKVRASAQSDEQFKALLETF